jgi:hypothetical protein
VGRSSTGGVLVLDSNLFLDVCVVATDVGVLGVRVVVTVRVEGVDDAFSYLVGGFVSNVMETVTETVVVAFLVVVTDVALVWGVDGGTSRCLYLLRVGVVLGSEGIFSVTRLFSDNGTGAFTDLALSYVNLRRGVVGGRAVGSVEVAVEGGVLDLDVGVGRLGREAIELRGSALRNLFGLAVARLLGDVNLLVLSRRLGTATVVLVDADLFLDVCLLGRVLRGRRRGVVVDRGRDVFVRLFVTFPPVCSRFRKGSFAFYLVWSVLGRCVSIRRREDTEGDRNSCFKIQFAGVPFEPFENNSKGFGVSLGEWG